MTSPAITPLAARLVRGWPLALWTIALFFAAPLAAEEVRLNYDSRGNVIAIEDASAAQTLRVQRFAPSYGRPGDGITVVGTGFSTTPSSNQAKIGGVTANVTAAAADHLKVTVTGGAVSGPIAVTVGANTATSTQNFTVLPSTLTAADITSATEMVVDAPAVRVNTLANRNALVSFAAQPGDLLSFQFTQLDLPNLGSATYQVFNPSGVSIASGTLYEHVRSIHLPPITAGGRYALYFKSTVTLRTQLLLESAAPIAVDGAFTASGTSFRGQSRRLKFAGTTGQNLGFALADRSVSPAPNASLGSPVFAKPDGSVLSSLSNLPQSGNYSVLLSPNSYATQSSFKAWVSNDLTASLTLNQLTTAAVTRPGQAYRYSVTGTAGQRLRLAAKTTTSVPLNQRIAFYFYKPDGSCLEPAVCYYNGAFSDNVYTLPPLPVSGTYTVLADINPYDDSSATFSAPFALSEEVAASLTIDGSAVDVATTAPGQYIRASFTATAGQNLGFAYTDVSLTPAGAYVNTPQIFAPNGAQITSLTNLPQTGTYAILIPLSAQTMTASMKLWLSADLTGTTAINQPTTSAVTRPGQAYRYTFSGTAGQKLWLHTTPTVSMPASMGAAVYVYKPDGSCLYSACYATTVSSYDAIELPVLPVSGTYRVLVDIHPYASNQNATFSTTFTLAEELAPTLAIDGSASSISTSIPGQYVRATFAGTAGQNLGFGYNNFSLLPAGEYLQTLSFIAPNGAALTSLSNLPQTGTYSVFLRFSAKTAEATANLWLSSDVTGSFTAGTATSVSVGRIGQLARYSYAGTAGQQLRLSTTATATTPASQGVVVYVYKPDGSYLYSGWYYNIADGSAQTNLPALPTTGNYTFVFDINPYGNGNSTFSTSATLTVLNP